MLCLHELDDGVNIFGSIDSNAFVLCKNDPDANIVFQQPQLFEFLTLFQFPGPGGDKPF